MKPITSFLPATGLAATLLLVGACQGPDKPAEKPEKVKTESATAAFVRTLRPTAVGYSGYTVALPPAYYVEEKRGPDFSVFYFAPTDTTRLDAISGGLYFGNFPSLFAPPDSTSCRTSTRSSRVLGQARPWTVYRCDSAYTVQSIVDSQSGEDWNRVVHLFGHGRNAAEAEQVLAIFATLQKKTPPATTQ